MAKLKIWDGSAWVEVKGEQGIQGIQGEQGIQGIQGIQGDPGADGNDGAQGIQGIQGDPGPSPLHTGTTAPADPGTQSIWIDTSS